MEKQQAEVQEPQFEVKKTSNWFKAHHFRTRVLTALGRRFHQFPFGLQHNCREFTH